MAGDWRIATFEKAPLQIIDGDRGKNYPNQAEFSPAGHCLFLNGGNVTTNGFRFSDCAFITAEKDALLRKGKLVRNDVVLTTRGTVGNAAYYDNSVPFDHIRINSGMVLFRAQTPDLQPQYLYLFVRSALFHAQVSALRTGSAQPQLPIQDINRVEIPIPPPDEQRAIAYILGTMDDKIKLERQINETLEAMGRALFKSWFVDFDPVRAKAEGRDPGLPKSMADLFPDSFEDSELGEIPKGWTAGCFGDVISQRTERVGSREAVVLSAVAAGELVRSDEHFTKRVYSKEINKYIAVEQGCQTHSRWEFMMANGAFNSPFVMHGSRAAMAAGLAHIEEQVIGIEQAVNDKPGLAFDLAKTLIESACRTILRERNVAFDPGDDLPKLFKTTTYYLPFLPASASGEAAVRKSLAQTLGGLSAAVQGVCELRNACGFASHGSDGPRPLMEGVQALLAAETADAIVGFLHRVHRNDRTSQVNKPATYEDNADFNSSVDELHELVRIFEEEFEPSRILFEMAPEPYRVYLTEFTQQSESTEEKQDDSGTSEAAP